MRAALVLLLASTPVGVALPACGILAQETPSARLQGVAKGASFDRFIYEGSGINAFSFRLSDLKPGALGTELGVSVFAQGLPGALVMAPDFGAGYNISVPRATLLLKAGGSAITGLTAEVVFIPGFHVGSGLVVRIDDRTGVRIDVIRHFYRDLDGETEAIWSIGVGFTALPRLRN